MLPDEQSTPEQIAIFRQMTPERRLSLAELPIREYGVGIVECRICRLKFLPDLEEDCELHQDKHWQILFWSITRAKLFAAPVKRFRVFCVFRGLSSLAHLWSSSNRSWFTLLVALDRFRLQ